MVNDKYLHLRTEHYEQFENLWDEFCTRFIGTNEQRQRIPSLRTSGKQIFYLS